jgi:hypothetical protein
MSAQFADLRLSLARRRGLILGALAAVVAVSAAAWVVRVVYLKPRLELADALDASRQWVAFYEQQLKPRTQVAAGLKSWGERALAKDQEEADARLRSALEAAASMQGLTNIQVGTTRPGGVANPISRSRSSDLRDLATQMRRRAERGQPDFFLLRADLAASGTLDQTVRLVAALQAQPWIHRLESVSFRPEDKERQKFQLRVVVSSVLVPDLTPAQRPDPVVVALNERQLALAGGIAQRNAFRTRLSTTPPAEARAPEQSPQAPDSVYRRWKLTGVTESRLGAQALLLNTLTSEQRAIPVGGMLLEARLVEAAGERAVFELDGRKMEVRSGESLDPRAAPAR